MPVPHQTRRHRMRRIIVISLAVLAAVLIPSMAFAPAVGALEGETFAITGVDVSNSMVTITNFGDVDVDPNGLILCNFPAYGPIEGADIIAPGESITVDSAAAGVPLSEAGEMGLYLAPNYEDPSSIVSYVEWGTGDHQRSPVAVEAGIWDGGFVDLQGETTLTGLNGNPAAVADWAAGDAGTTELAATGVSSWIVALVAASLLAAGGLAVIASGRIDPRRSTD